MIIASRLQTFRLRGTHVITILVYIKHLGKDKKGEQVPL
jgi:hypothetical protein